MGLAGPLLRHILCGDRRLLRFDWTEILDRKEKVKLLPMLIMQGGLDDTVIPPIQEKFAATYRAAGGECQLEIFENSEHEWTAVPSPEADRSHDMVKAFIARQLRALQKAA